MKNLKLSFFSRERERQRDKQRETKRQREKCLEIRDVWIERRVWDFIGEEMCRSGF